MQESDGDFVTISARVILERRKEKEKQRKKVVSFLVIWAGQKLKENSTSIASIYLQGELKSHASPRQNSFETKATVNEPQKRLTCV